MFIELTDHLRCPAEHEEAFLVLVPDAVRERGVATGLLGCPICGTEYPVIDGVARFGAVPFASVPTSSIPADGLHALLGIGGPGGYVVFVGGPSQLAVDDEVTFAGLGAVLVNPPFGVADAPPRISVVEGACVPLKARSVRGVVLGAGYADDAAWIAEARRVLLPGRHLVGEGQVPSESTAPGLQLLASAGGWWVGV